MSSSYEEKGLLDKHSRDEDDSSLEENFEPRRRPQRALFFTLRQLAFAVLASLLFLTSGIVVGSLLSTFIASHSNVASGLTGYSKPASPCQSVEVRREWRSLSREEKRSYIESVKCLYDKPSRLGLGQTLFHDFSWVHSRIGGISHEAAPFLSWHRAFLGVFHKTLQRECHYKGQLTYWDWTLDWENITLSPVWDPETGFGGNGDMTKGEDILDGHCVVDGPFAGIETSLLGEESDHPHCLSRGFETGEDLLNHGKWFNPEAMETLLSHPEYTEFNLGLENGPHNAIPRSIRGDFLMLTAPFDPVFFLHHTQLDRMWWLWQHMEPDRLMKYSGDALHNTTRPATLDDIMALGGLGPDVKVRDIIDPESGYLCYRY